MMTALTESEINTAVAAADVDFANAFTQLAGAQSNFLSQVDATVNSLKSSLTALDTGTNLAIDAATGLTNGLISSAESTLNGALQLLDAGLNSAIGLLQFFAESQNAADNAQFETDRTTATNQFQTDYDAIKNKHVMDVNNARAGYGSDLDTFGGLFHGAVSSAEGLFDSQVAGFDSTLNSTIDTETGNYQTAETSYWNGYVSQMDGSPTGQQGIHNAALTAADTALNSVLTAWLGVEFAPTIVTNTSGFQSFVDGEATSLWTNVGGEEISFDNTVEARVTKLKTDIDAAAGPLGVLRTNVEALENDFESDAFNANYNFKTSVENAKYAYEAAVKYNTPSLLSQLESNLATEETTFKANIATAYTNYNDAMIGPRTTRETAVNGAISGFEAWCDSNPILTSIRALNAPLIVDLNGYLATYQTSADNAETAFNNAVLIANQKYWDAVFDPSSTPTSIYFQYKDNLVSVNNQLKIDLAAEFNQYQTTVSTAPSSVPIVVGTGAVVLPTTGVNVIDQARKVYWVQTEAAEATAQQQNGLAWEAYITAAVGKDTTRQQDIIAAWETYATAVETARHALATSGIARLGTYQGAMINLTHQLAVAGEAQAATTKTTILNASNALQLTHNNEQETLSKAGATAVQTHKKNAANHLNAFRIGEHAQWKTYENKVAEARNKWEVKMFGADIPTAGPAENGLVPQLMTDVAAEKKAAQQGINSLTKAAETDIHGYEVTHVANQLGFAQTFVNNVMNQLATDYSTAHGGDAGQTAVGNAYAANAIARMDADAAFINGEASAFQNYADQESARRQIASDNIATAGETRSKQIFALTTTPSGGLTVGAFPALMNTISSEELSFSNSMASSKQTASDNIANADKKKQQDTQDKIKIANDAIIGDEHTRSDAVTNTTYGFLKTLVTLVSGAFVAEDSLQNGFDSLKNSLLTTLEQTKETLINSRNLLAITLKKNAANALSTSDDPVIIALAAAVSKTPTQARWHVAATDSARPTGDFASRPPTLITPDFTEFSVGLPVIPTRPGAPPSPASNAPTVVDPNDFREPEIGFVNGLKTGLKALANATADTGAGLISLGQWDPADVWKVTSDDLYYDDASIAANIGVAVGSAVVTGGFGAAGRVGRVAQIARWADRVDAAGNAVVGLQGVGAMVGGGNINAQNALQVATGALGAAQLKSAANAAKVEDVARQASGTAGGFPGLRYSSQLESSTIVNQTGNMTCAPACARQVLLDQGLDFAESRIANLAQTIHVGPAAGTGADKLAKAMNDLVGEMRFQGGSPRTVSAELLLKARKQFIAYLGSSSGRHAVIVDKIENGMVSLRDPWGISGPGSGSGVEAFMDRDLFYEAWGRARHMGVY